jgi:acetylornithine deacetylase/succinyl-diaminopimelate desuccinylase-like protein
MKSFEEKVSLKVPKEIRQKVLQCIDSENVINLCSRLIQFDSVVETEAAEKEIADYVASHFRKLGLDVKIVPLPEGLPGVPKGPHPQVIATLKGSAEKPVFMVEGHLDTEPVVNRDKWTHDPFSGDVDRKEGYIYGVGTVNMKQSIASFMEAIRAIVASGVKLKGSLMFGGWAQENGGLIGSKYATTHWKELGLGPLPDSVLGGEQTDCSAWTSNVAMGLFVITTYGRLAHFSSRYTHHPAYNDSRHINAVDKMLKIMNEMKDVRKTFVYEKGHFLGDPVMSFGKITSKIAGEGGRACLGADECELYVDIRFPPGMTKESCKRDLERMIYNLSIEDPELRATVKTSPALFGIESVPVVTPRDLPLIKTLEATHREIFGEDLIVDLDGDGTTTHRSIDWNRYAGSDMTSFYSVGVPGVNYGPGTVPVTPDERVSIPQLVNHCKVVALTILETCGIA